MARHRTEGKSSFFLSSWTQFPYSCSYWPSRCSINSWETTPFCLKIQCFRWTKMRVSSLGSGPSILKDLFPLPFSIAHIYEPLVKNKWLPIGNPTRNMQPSWHRIIFKWVRWDMNILFQFQVQTQRIPFLLSIFSRDFQE